MTNDKQPRYVLGIDYGTDSCRAVVTDAQNGKEVATATALYPRWAKGLYCNPAKNQFRQHPRDYVESLESVMEQVFEKTGDTVLPYVQGIAIDTTGSTPCLMTEKLEPLALLPEFENEPDAMFILWKDHTSTQEAAQINELAHSWKIDYTMYEGGVYSSEWFWAKILHVAKTNPRVIKAAFSAIEHSDWMPALLTGLVGRPALDSLKRSRCAMGHKAMWHESFGGYPSDEFFGALEGGNKNLVRIKNTLGTKTYTSDTEFGKLTEEWAQRLHLKAGLPVAVGAYDAHMGAVGGGVAKGVLVKVMGTSTCDIIVGPRPEVARGEKERLVRGICGQVDGSVVPGMIGYEAGQSAFGDTYAWFKTLLMWPFAAMTADGSKFLDTTRFNLTADELAALSAGVDAQLMPALERAATAIDPQESGVLALDWLNGRRTPDANQELKGAIMGLTLGTNAPMVYRALIEATAYGARAIVERFEQEGIRIERVRGIGGVARKSPLVMQIVADVLGRPIEIVASDQSVALGAAMFAAVVAGIYDSIPQAQSAMAPAIEKVVSPNAPQVAVYDKLYREYLKFGAFIEKESV